MMSGVLFTAPTAFRAIRQQDPDGKLIGRYDLARFRTLFLAGERADPPTVQWAEEKLKVPVIDHWWQTETGWPIGANCLGIEKLPVKYGSCTKAVPGWDVRVLEAEAIGQAKEMKPGEIGALAVKLPLPPGTLPTLWQQDERVVERLPKTRSGKILRGTIRRIADGQDYTMPATIDDPAILPEIAEALATAGYPQRS